MGLHGRDWTGVAHAFASVLCLGSNQTMTRVDGVPMMMMMMMIHEKKKKKKQTMTNNKRAYFVSTLYNRIMIVIVIVILIVKLVAGPSNLRLFVVAFAVVRC